MGLTKGNKYMFQAVRCRAYLRRIKDGKWFANDGGKYVMVCGEDENGNEISKECTEYDGSESLLKTYYERTEKDFYGMVVATITVALKKRLYIGIAEPDYGPDYTYVGKETVETAECARVFYANGKSRLVPLEDIEIIDEAREGGKQDELQ